MNDNAATVPPPNARPKVTFRLPGQWCQIDLSSSEATEESIRRAVKQTMGTVDEQATLRERARRELRAASQQAREGEATALFLCTKLNAQTDLPLSLVIYEPSDLRMSPTVGTGPGQVLDTLERSLSRVDTEHGSTLARRTFRSGEALRTHTVTSEELDEGAVVERLIVNYWYPVPGSKHLILASFMTPLGSIPHVMLSFTDAIVGTSFFDMTGPQAHLN